MKRTVLHGEIDREDGGQRTDRDSDVAGRHALQEAQAFGSPEFLEVTPAGIAHR
jgi:hypothetical protein